MHQREEMAQDSFLHETCSIQPQNDPVRQGFWAETLMLVYHHLYEMAVSHIESQLVLLAIVDYIA